MRETPFQGTITQALYGAEAGSYEVPDWADHMFVGLLREWERVYWNIHQASFPDRPTERVSIGAVTYQPYVWVGCDCGGKEIQHKPDCRWRLEHDEWNRRRLDAMCEPAKPMPPQEQIDRVREAGGMMAVFGMLFENSGRRLEFDPAKEDAWIEANPRPPCTCGEADGWEERDCSEQCISRAPNFGLHGDVVQIRWYKYPGRGMSVTVPMGPQDWIDWHDRIVWELQRAEHDHQFARYKADDPSIDYCPVYFSQCRFCSPKVERP